MLELMDIYGIFIGDFVDRNLGIPSGKQPHRHGKTP